MKKHLLFILAALLPMLASAKKVEIYGIWYNLDAETNEAEVTFLGASSGSYDEYSGSITIPATVTYDGVKYSVTSIGSEAFYFCVSLTAITIPESVKSIRDRAFYFCYNLTAINIPESVKSIGVEAFYNCNKLTSITIPENSQLTSIGGDAFEDCSRLTAVHISDIAAWCNIEFYNYTSNPLYHAHNLYLNGKLLKQLTIPEGVTRIGQYAFYYCSSLTAINIPESVKSIGSGAFYRCSSLTAITIPEGVTSIRKFTFDGCSSLTAINIPESVKSIGDYAFRDCESLTAITIPESVKSIGIYTFDGCRSLTAITIPKSVTNIGNQAFDNCTALKEVIFEDGSETLSLGYNSYYSSGTGEGLFYDCPLESVYLRRNLSYSSGRSYGYSPFYNKTKLTSVVICDCVTSIGDYAFYKCYSLTAINIPEGVTSIGNGAFEDCSSLTAVHISDIAAWCNIKFSNSDSNPLYYAHNLYLNGELVTQLTIPEGVTSIGWYAFASCSSLTVITIPEGVTSIGRGAFDNCTALKEVIFEDGSETLSLGYNYYSNNAGEGLFYDCPLESVYLGRNLSYSSGSSYGCSPFYNKTKLTSVVIGDGVTSIGYYAFGNCSSLTTINIPEGVTSIGYYAFYGCSSLTAITIPESVTSIESHTFFGCSSLTTITIPESVTSIRGWAFEDCSSLTAITIPEGVTSIGSDAFYGCSSLTAIVLPKNLKNIYSEAFANCSELLDVYCYAEKVPTTETDAFNNSNIENATLHVPANALNAYKTTAPWSSFGKFETIETLVEDITLSQSSATLIEGGTLTLTATVTPDDATDNSITWSSSNTSVATVDNTGKVIAIAPGNATITATAGDGSGVSASCEVTVEKKVVAISSITLSQSSATLTEGETLSLNATVKPTNATNKGITWSSSNASVATVDANGKVTAITPGTATITATANDGSGAKASCKVTVVAAEYTITYYVDGEIYHQETLTRGTAIVPIEAPEKEGHTFSGWSEVPATMPAEDITITGTFTVNTYTVTFTIDGVVIASSTQEYGSAITVPSAPTREGYTFSGWGEVPTTMPASDVTYDATYIPNTYKVYYFVGDRLVHVAEVAYGEVIPEYIYEPTTEGDVFMGWIGDTYDTMPAHDVTYTANIANGIENSEINTLNSEFIYDLMGSKVTDTENLTGGVYIIGGKKVIIK